MHHHSNGSFIAPETNRNLITLKNQWHTDSTKQSSTVATYAKYQVQTYLETKGLIFASYLKLNYWFRISITKAKT